MNGEASSRKGPVFVDFESLVCNMEGDPELALDICRIFLRNSPREMEALGQAVRDREEITAFARVHSFKFIIGLFGVGEGMEAIALLESLIHAARWEEVDERLSIFSILIGEIRQALQALLPDSGAQDVPA